MHACYAAVCMYGDNLNHSVKLKFPFICSTIGQASDYSYLNLMFL